MSYLTLSSLDIHTCHELLGAGTGLFWHNTWHGTVGVSDWDFTGLCENQDCAVKKCTVVFLC